MTVSQLAERLALATIGVQPEFLVRRLRHWTAAGALPTEGDPESGTGHHRTYGAEAVYFAVVLNCLADVGASIETLKDAGTALQLLAAGPRYRPLWLAAQRGSETVFLDCMVRPEAPVPFRARLWTAAELPLVVGAPSFALGLHMLLRLTDAFSRIST